MINLVYQDEYLLAVHKPPGIHVHPTFLSPGEESLQDQLEHHLGRRPQPLHRLDRPTSGLVLFAWTTQDVSALSRDFRDRGVKKEYQALVRGWCPAFSTKKPLEDLDGNGGLQEAVTTVYPLVQYEVDQAVGRYATARFSLVSLEPHTGRRHQLRRHLKSANHPLVGDTRYLDGRYNEFFRTRFNHHRLFLLAKRLEMVHPRTGENLILETDWEEDVQELFLRLEEYRTPRSIPKEG